MHGSGGFQTRDKPKTGRLCKNCQARKLNRDVAMYHSRRRKLIKDG